MSAALKIAQSIHDHALPPEDDERDEAVNAWLAESAEQLIRFKSDVMFKPRFGPPRGVTFDRFARAVDEYAMQQLIASGANPAALGYLILSAKFGSPAEASTAADGVLNVPDPEQALREIAEALLEPYADDALLAKAEDDAL